MDSANCHPNRKHHAKGLCKKCYGQMHYRKNYADISERLKKYRMDNAEKIKESNIRYRIENAEKIQKSEHSPNRRAQRFCKHHTICHYNEVLHWFLPPLIDSLCWLCGEPRSGRMELDHDHKTGTIRGWTHHHCNIAEGNVMRSPNPIALTTNLLEMAAAVRMT